MGGNTLGIAARSETGMWRPDSTEYLIKERA